MGAMSAEDGARRRVGADHVPEPPAHVPPGRHGASFLSPTVTEADPPVRSSPPYDAPSRKERTRHVERRS